MNILCGCVISLLETPLSISVSHETTLPWEKAWQLALQFQCLKLTKAHLNFLKNNFANGDIWKKLRQLEF